MKTLHQHLCDYAELERISFAMPGHKGGRGLLSDFKSNIAKIDVTELPDTENLHAPRHILSAASKELSALYHSKKSFFLTGGSTEGIHIMLHAAASGGKLLVNRTCHRSVVNCCVLSGIVPIFINQTPDENLLTSCRTEPLAVERALSENPDASAVMITSPSFYGTLSDIKAIAKICHAHRVPLLVDEAHGAHFAASGLPDGAMELGADMSVQSAHKTLNALNQAAFLHLSGSLIDEERVGALCTMVGTSSPSYPIIASAQLALADLAGDSWRQLCDYISNKKREIKASTHLIMPDGAIDPSRIVLGFRDYNITGFEVERILRQKYNIDIEMADYKNIVCIATPSNTRCEIDALFAAIGEICASLSTCPFKGFTLPPLPDYALSPRDAFFARGEVVPLDNAAGRVSKTAITAYPPGIALVSYGERIDNNIIKYIKELMNMGAAIEGLTSEVGVCVMTEKL